METINSISYPIYFNNSLAELANFIKAGNYTKFFILIDEFTGEHCLPIVQKHLGEDAVYDLIEVAAGEENKNIDFCIGIWKMLIDFGADRNSLLINLGGGVITDMGGFAASTYKRGIDFVHVPTTLLSQVDASVGGKTGIDLDSIKNIIGTFTQPKAVFMEHSFISTLPARQVLSGVAEMLKHGLIADADYWNKLKEADFTQPSADLVHRSVEIKNDIVIEDPKEKGVRKALNFGHTIGHAVETWSLDNDKNHLTHGEAIAIGMICEAWLSWKKNGLSEANLNEIVSTFRSLYPAYKISADCHKDLFILMQKDKKNNGNNINCTLLTAIGKCSIDHICTEEELCNSLNYYSSL
ncbi:3-dehydroquinate synthase [Mucilaginibacter myungsuensis]|uniref:3-dehydroquinate synthase n=2 Tax=Mucilaginibacter myungsuensis TaxID=649104 RepID=A0A929KX22_9SPHI|nr:3-dehydroquinate synthase [Mucilaginibacter myungsuensis]MBE9663221.1 3-dehydroquinate synthase [Mucilaginibacter myungsuensis]MDN3598854.1 3-dehydroquinate synthase [Mucilaginibacter myungsuensis]